MTITRADVESLLAAVTELFNDPNDTVAELCRSWLAVDDAPSGVTVGCGQHKTTFITTYIPAGTYKLVCIDTPQRERKWYDEGTPVEESAVSNAVGPGGIDTPTGGREGEDGR